MRLTLASDLRFRRVAQRRGRVDPIDVDSDNDGVQDGNDDSDGDQVQDGDQDGSPNDGQGDLNESTCAAGDVEDGL